ncbi:ethanolamine utilization protein EutH [Gordonia sp. CNJ-863]|uniref:ethanolamine utilization protein EutH n=1 Tax=Gordonia TaxID=2053 RepID=UPI0009646EE4|nr:MULTISPECIES: ethanolamine utilization protein EutH [Gordonia]MDJ0028088.1 ethanolamine utilization protein EutH [Gordonia alkanivorans]OLT44430.1 ethanolamine utilization protein EutH [Gordonia sp. CNJ-863]WJG13132.1 ethanolamine utilization protein EutH [Gordonia sp. Swx-4]
MELFGQIIIYIMMAFLLLGAGAYIFKPGSPLGEEFREGLMSIGPIFIPVGGMMAIIPFLADAIDKWIAPAYRWMHSDASIAVSSFIPADQGAYQLSLEVAGSHNAWILAFAVAMTAGSTITFSVPVGLAMLPKKDHKFMALGVMAGLLAIPFTAFFMTLILAQTGVLLREDVSVDSPSTKPFDLPVGDILLNLIPLVVLMVVLALMLKFFPRQAITGFMAFGQLIRGVTAAALALSIVEYFTGVFSWMFGSWGLAPFIADEENQFRALETAGYIGVMLAGAFPMVYAIRTWLEKPLALLGKRVGVSEAGMAGFFAGAANVLALFRVVPLMPPRDKVLTIAFAVCAAFAIGDFIAFTANFQPNMIGAMLIGKLLGGIVAIFIALWLAVPHAERLGKEDEAAEARARAADSVEPDAGDLAERV